MKSLTDLGLVIQNLTAHQRAMLRPGDQSVWPCGCSASRLLKTRQSKAMGKHTLSMRASLETDRRNHKKQRLQEAYKLMTAGPPCVVPGLKMQSYTVQLPLDHGNPETGSIEVFFRVVEATADFDSSGYLLYLQGGPGFEALRPTEASGWLGKAVTHFNVVLLDQRGTGKSSPVTAQSLAKLGGPENQTGYLQHFRADNIVKDSEIIRSVLIGPDEQWSILGQSFGGFCCLRYLSTAPQSLSEVFMTGGIPPGINLPCSAEEAYKRLYRRVITQNNKFYSRFPMDVAIMQRLVMHLDSRQEGGAPLPSGGLLTPRALQLLGLSGLGSVGGFERLHFLLERAFDGDDISSVFLSNFEAWMPWATNPLYAVLHESIYCQGARSSWAAHRVREDHFQDEFDAVKAAQEGRQVNFTGEMVFPWMFEDFAELRPLRDAAHLIAAKGDWPQLYDEAVLRKNDVPIAAACYFDDMYVDFDMAQETASRVKNLRQWVTNEYMHSGLREEGNRIFDTLLSMTRNIRPLF